MDVFISWSGNRGRALGQSIKRWLGSVVQRARPWMSEEDIGVGRRWNHELSAQLEKSDFGIVCVTPESMASPWLLFEAGALAKSVDTGRVVPVLLGLKRVDLEPPLGQFQAVEASRDGMRTLVFGVNSVLADDALVEDTLTTAFDALWPHLEKSIGEIPDTDAMAAERSVRSDRDVLEEVLETVRRMRDPARGRTEDNSPVSGEYLPLLASLASAAELRGMSKPYDLKAILDEIERLAVLCALRAVGTQTGAARSLGLTFRSLRYLVAKHKLTEWAELEERGDGPDEPTTSSALLKRP